MKARLDLLLDFFQLKSSAVYFGVFALMGRNQFHFLIFVAQHSNSVHQHSSGIKRPQLYLC